MQEKVDTIRKEKQEALTKQREEERKRKEAAAELERLRALQVRKFYT